MDHVTVWNIVKSKILGNFNLWDLLLQKVGFYEEEKICQSSTYQSSPEEKVNFLLGQIEELLNQVSLMWKACCDSLLLYCPVNQNYLKN